MMPAVVAGLAAAGIAVLELTLGRPSLDEVFLTITGHRAEDDTTATRTSRRRSHDHRHTHPRDREPLTSRPAAGRTGGSRRPPDCGTGSPSPGET